MFEDNLDEYESELENSLNFKDIKPLKNAKALKKQAKIAAANTLRKDRKITIRVSSFDIDMLKRIAINQGLPYQTLITSLLHKYVTGQTAH